MRMITLPRAAVHTGPLILVNRQYPIQGQYLSSIRLTSLTPAAAMESTAANLLLACMQALSGSQDILYVSGYRSHEEQTALYSQSIADHGLDFTEQFVAQPGASEHETGLAMDLGLKQKEIDFIRPAFPDTGICAQFTDLAAKYGFIRRYTAKKQAQTGIADEPWHFRYVGRPHARVMETLGLCLEEYIELIRKYRYMGEHYLVSDGNRKAELFFVRAGARETILSMPDNGFFQISGNNCDGFIVTYWR